MDRRALFIRYLPVLLLPAGMAAAEDFKLSDGTVLRGARVVEVRPDALVVAHDKGVALANLEKLPREIRARYGYDPRKAAAYRERDATARRTTAEENRRLIAAHEERQQALARAEWEAHETPGAGSGNAGEIRFSPRVSASERAFSAGVAGISGQIAQADQARIAANSPMTFWTAPFWKHPAVRALGFLLGGEAARESSGTPEPVSNSEPRNWR